MGAAGLGGLRAASAFTSSTRKAEQGEHATVPRAGDSVVSPPAQHQGCGYRHKSPPQLWRETSVSPQRIHPGSVRDSAVASNSLQLALDLNYPRY